MKTKLNKSIKTDDEEKQLLLIDFILEKEKDFNIESTGLENTLRKYKDPLFEILEFAKKLNSYK